MTKDSVSMPQGMAGLTRYNTEDSSRIKLKPAHVIVLLVIVVLVVLLLHMFGNSLLGLSAAGVAIL